MSSFSSADGSGAGAGAGIAYLMGTDLDGISHTVANAIATTGGIVCDGAKASCASKIATAVEAGILGFAGFLASMLWNVKNAARQVRHCPDSAARTITAACAAALCGGMVNGLADYLWHYPRVMCIFWFVFAIALAGVKVCCQEEEKGRTSETT